MRPSSGFQHCSSVRCGSSSISIFRCHVGILSSRTGSISSSIAFLSGLNGKLPGCTRIKDQLSQSCNFIHGYDFFIGNHNIIHQDGELRAGEQIRHGIKQLDFASNQSCHRGGLLRHFIDDRVVLDSCLVVQLGSVRLYAGKHRIAIIRNFTRFTFVGKCDIDFAACITLFCGQLNTCYGLANIKSYPVVRVVHGTPPLFDN